MLRQFFTFTTLCVFLCIATGKIYGQDAQVSSGDEQKKEEASTQDKASDEVSVPKQPNDEKGEDVVEDKDEDKASEDKDADTSLDKTAKDEPKKDTDKADSLPEKKPVDSTTKDEKEQGEQKREASIEEDVLVEEELEEPILEEEPSFEEEQGPEEFESVEQEVVEQEPENEDEDEALEDVISIDTLSVEEPSGNWVFKRHWYQKAQSKYGQIGATISRILQSRSELMKLNESIQNELLDSFYKEIGFNLGEANTVIESLLEQLNELRKKKGGLNDEQAALFNRLEGAHDELEQLALDLEDVTAHDNAFERTMGLVIQQIDAAYAYQNQAFDAVQTIARELNDLAAKGEYLKVRSYARSVRDIQAYLEGDLTKYLNTLGQQLAQLTQQISTELSQLKDAGIDIKEEAQRLHGELCLAEAPMQAAPEQVSSDSEPGFVSRIMQSIASALTWPLRALSLISDETEPGPIEAEQLGGADTISE